MARIPSRLLDLFRRALGSGARVATARESGRGRPALLRALAAVAPQAHARGLRLLRENLSAEQRGQHEKYGYFEVVGGQTGRQYRIKNGAQMNIEMLDTRGRPAGELCFVPEGGLPVGDVMLAQKLALELFEQDALKAANTFPSRYHNWSLDPPPFGNQTPA
jgi:hypothetical protein